MSKSLLLISQNPEDQAFAMEVAKGCELPLVLAASAEAGAERIARDEAHVIIVDASTPELYQAFEAAVQEKVGLFSAQVNPNYIHFIHLESMDSAPYIIKSPIFGHFIMRGYGDPAVSGQHYGYIVRSSLNDRAFGLASLLKPGAKVQKINFTSTAQKQGAVEAVRNYALAAQFKVRMAAVVANALDEILMNAMFDAPVDGVGKPLLGLTARSTVIKLEGRHAIEMQVGFDGSHLAISVTDHFGSLDKTKLLNFVSKAYREEEYKLRTMSAGAGIGLATVFQSGGSLLFVSEAGVRTEVTVIFRRADSYREFKDQFRFMSTLLYL